MSQEKIERIRQELYTLSSDGQHPRDVDWLCDLALRAFVERPVEGVKLWSDGRIAYCEDKMIEDHIRALQSQLRSQGALREKLEEAEARSNYSVCVWCGYKGPKEANNMADHMLTCEKHPVKALMDLRTIVEAEWQVHSFLTPEGERQAADAVGFMLLKLFPPLSAAPKSNMEGE